MNFHESPISSSDALFDIHPAKCPSTHGASGVGYYIYDAQMNELCAFCGTPYPKDWRKVHQIPEWSNVDTMLANTERHRQSEEMPAEVDISGGIRGKYYERYQQYLAQRRGHEFGLRHTEYGQRFLLLVKSRPFCALVGGIFAALSYFFWKWFDKF